MTLQPAKTPRLLPLDPLHLATGETGKDFIGRVFAKALLQRQRVLQFTAAALTRTCVVRLVDQIVRPGNPQSTYEISFLFLSWSQSSSVRVLRSYLQ